ncbi:type I deoxyribonuclease HsdR [Flavobacterium sp. UMI-01]|nr:HTTM domain-containing protein [Flavobacterium sp. UMI-01]GIZ08424.1 type I deoxyribonuclease HsdR [Flavobacterium sp. UMI-01]
MLSNYFKQNTSAATLAFYRLAFGLMMLLSLIRFASYGWIKKFYIEPQFHFTYYGFEWVKPIGIYTYLIFIVCGIAALFVAIGFQYRWAILIFFLSFTYIELMDKTTYLNHYYFISIISFVLCFLPAQSYFSVDAYRNEKIRFQKIPKWTLDILKLFLAIVYIYAGIAKLNSDWLFEAMPLKIWLPDNTNLPVLGYLLNQTWTHYAFSWVGALYDLVIVFLLLNKRTRGFGFFLVVVFHVLTRILFPIGVFPYVMIISSLIFFEATFHKKILQWIARLFSFDYSLFENGKHKNQCFSPTQQIKLSFLTLFIMFHLVFPFRYWCYPNELFWTEEGFRFSWRVMLMEKAGYAEFTVRDAKNNKSIRVNNAQFLTPFQEKQMAFQPDFILEYAHFLRDHYQKQGFENPEVYVNSYVALNGRLSQQYIDPTINLVKEHESFKHKTWILPFNDTIKGL